MCPDFYFLFKNKVNAMQYKCIPIYMPVYQPSKYFFKLQRKITNENYFNIFYNYIYVLTDITKITLNNYY